jgi:hypothetical protein
MSGQVECFVPYDGGFLILENNTLTHKKQDNTMRAIYTITREHTGGAFTKRMFVDEKYVYLQINERECYYFNMRKKTVLLVLLPGTFYPYQGYVYGSKNSSKIYTTQVTALKYAVYRYHAGKVTAMYANESRLITGDADGFCCIKKIRLFEEDSLTYDDITVASDSIVEPARVEHCRTQTIFDLEDYTQEDNPFMVYFLNAANKYVPSAQCFTVEEFKAFLATDLNIEFPDNMMAINTRPQISKGEDDPTYSMNGFGTNPTGQIVIKLPIGMYVTYGSARRLISESDVKA